MNSVVNEVKGKIALTPHEDQELHLFLEVIERKLKSLNLNLNFGQWVALSIHLVNLFRRAQEKESVPNVDSSLWDQISQQIIETSRSILEPIKDCFQESHYSSEVFLLAVHLEGACQIEGGE